MLGWFKKKHAKKDNKINRELEDAGQNRQETLSREEPITGNRILDEDSPTVSPQTAESDAEEGGTTEPLEPGETGLFKRLKAGLAKTRDSLVNRMDKLFLGKKRIDPELLDELEEILITADLGVNTTQELLEDARAQVGRNELSDPQALKKNLKDKIYSYLVKPERKAEPVAPGADPFVIMVVGVNGVGKTTTIGKMAYKFVQTGKNVVLVAADTFRAAAIDQLKIWGSRIKVEVIAQKPGADPSSVVYDAIDYATSRSFDVIIIDTAGRLHTKTNLMEELKKIKRVIGKKITDAPHEIMLVLDATTGQNSISQTKLFHEAVGITGLTLTKLDGTAKGGIIINVAHELNIPIRFIGIGEQMEDLRDFEPKEFVDALFADAEMTTND